MKSGHNDKHRIPTDRKFQPQDEHLLALDKEEIASNPHQLTPGRHDKHDHGEAEDAAKARSTKGTTHDTKDV